MQAKLPLLTACGVAIGGFLFVWLIGPPFDGGSLEQLCGAVPEGASYGFELRWWPPGATHCVIERMDGTTTTHTYVPWREWLTIALLAAASGLLVRALLRPRGRAASAAAAVLAWFAATAVFFV